MKSLRDARAAIQDWLRSVELNVPADVVPVAGDVGNFTCTYHQTIARGVSGLTQANVTVRVYVSRAEESEAHVQADDAQTTLYESLEAWPGPWANLTVTDSTVAEENLAEAKYVSVRLSVRLFL